MIDISFRNTTGIKPDILSAVIGADSFFYGLFSGHKLLECKHYDIADFSDHSITSVIQNDLRHVLASSLIVKISYKGKPYLHVDKEESGALLKFFPAFANKAIDSNRFVNQAVNVDFGINQSVDDFLDKLGVRKLQKYHISSVFAYYYYPYVDQKMIVHVEDQKVHIFYASDRAFVYYNQFHCTTDRDYLYFTLLAAKELELNPEAMNVELSGKIDTESSIYKLMRTYIRNLNPMKSSKLQVEDDRYSTMHHYYLDLYATSLCE